MLSRRRESKTMLSITARVSRFCCPVHRTLVSLDRHYGIPLRQSLRLLDGDGQELKHPYDIDPQPKPVVRQKAADKRPKNKKQNQGPIRRSIDSNAASLE